MPAFLKPVETPSIKTPKELMLEIFQQASKIVEQELEALDVLNRSKAIKEISELFDLNPQELYMYIEYGEEEYLRLSTIKEEDEDNVSTTTNPGSKSTSFATAGSRNIW